MTNGFWWIDQGMAMQEFQKRQKKHFRNLLLTTLNNESNWYVLLY